AVRKRKLDGLFNSNAARADSPVLQNPRDNLVWTLVFFPGAHVAAQLYLLERSPLLKSRSHVPGLAFCRENHSKQSLPQPPVDPGKVVKARSTCQKDTVYSLIPHVPARLFLTAQILLPSDRPGLSCG